MVNIFHLMGLILCCNRAIEYKEQKKIDQMVIEEYRIMKEWRKKKQADKLEVTLPNNKEE